MDAAAIGKDANKTSCTDAPRSCQTTSSRLCRKRTRPDHATNVEADGNSIKFNISDHAAGSRLTIFNTLFPAPLHRFVRRPALR